MPSMNSTNFVEARYTEFDTFVSWPTAAEKLGLSHGDRVIVLNPDEFYRLQSLANKAAGADSLLHEQPKK